MNAYYCTACRRTSYSAAELENMIDSRCPYCGAGIEDQREGEDDKERARKPN